MWLAVRLRREALASFFVSLAYFHQRSMSAADKPSPTFEALLRSEMEMRAAGGLRAAMAAASPASKL